MKYLVLLVVLVVAIGIWRSRRQSDVASTASPDTRALPQDMLACAHCGVHVPRAEALLAGRHAYCCAEHQRMGPG
jgi:uncharacterized protein